MGRMYSNTKKSGNIVMRLLIISLSKYTLVLSIIVIYPLFNEKTQVCLWIYTWDGKTGKKSYEIKPFMRYRPSLPIKGKRWQWLIPLKSWARDTQKMWSWEVCMKGERKGKEKAKEKEQTYNVGKKKKKKRR